MTRMFFKTTLAIGLMYLAVATIFLLRDVASEAKWTQQAAAQPKEQLRRQLDADEYHSKLARVTIEERGIPGLLLCVIGAIGWYRTRPKRSTTELQLPDSELVDQDLSPGGFRVSR